jgi:hypothetical protein
MKPKIEDEIENDLMEEESTEETREELLENDEITPEEEAFIRGCEEAEFEENEEE